MENLYDLLIGALHWVSFRNNHGYTLSWHFKYNVIENIEIRSINQSLKDILVKALIGWIII
jgi:hypothetical protein